MEAVGHVVGVLLQIEYLEVASLLVVERHGVATASYGRRVVGRKTCLVGRGKERGGSCPVLG